MSLKFFDLGIGLGELGLKSSQLFGRSSGCSLNGLSGGSYCSLKLVKETGSLSLFLCISSTVGAELRQNSGFVDTGSPFSVSVSRGLAGVFRVEVLVKLASLVGQSEANELDGSLVRATHTSANFVLLDVVSPLGEKVESLLGGVRNVEVGQVCEGSSGLSVLVDANDRVSTASHVHEVVLLVEGDVSNTA